jgi:hypothetical protein
MKTQVMLTIRTPWFIEWRSPVEVDVLTSAAVNADDIRHGLEKEKLKIEREEMEQRKRKAEERRKQNERAMAERQRLSEEAKNKKEEEIARLKKLMKNFVKEKGKRKETDKGKAKGSGGENEDDQPQTKDPPEVNQNPTFSSTIAHLLSPPTQPSQAPDPDPNSTYALALQNTEIQIEKTMYARISRILHLFQLHQTPHLILGSFGTGVSKNRIDLIATIFADLLIKPGGRFKDVFQTVVFAILGKETVRVFSEVFLRADKRAQREGTGKTRVFVDSFGSGGDEDVKEGDEEKRKRMKRTARRSELGRKNS